MQGVLPLAILREHQEFICGKLGSDGVFRSEEAERLERDSLLDIQAVRNRHVRSSFIPLASPCIIIATCCVCREGKDGGHSWRVWSCLT